MESSLFQDVASQPAEAHPDVPEHFYPRMSISADLQTSVLGRFADAPSAVASYSLLHCDGE